MEDNKLEKGLESFLNEENPEKKEKNDIAQNKKIVKEKDGLIEVVDKKLVLEDGRQLLREQLYEAN